jgi:hypothetical protein
MLVSAAGLCEFGCACRLPVAASAIVPAQTSAAMPYPDLKRRLSSGDEDYHAARLCRPADG